MQFPILSRQVAEDNFDPSPFHFLPTDDISCDDFFLTSQNIQRLAKQRAKVSAIIDNDFEGCRPKF